MDAPFPFSFIRFLHSYFFFFTIPSFPSPCYISFFRPFSSFLLFSFVLAALFFLASLLILQFSSLSRAFIVLARPPFFPSSLTFFFPSTRATNFFIFLSYYPAFFLSFSHRTISFLLPFLSLFFSLIPLGVPPFFNSSPLFISFSLRYFLQKYCNPPNQNWK